MLELTPPYNSLDPHIVVREPDAVPYLFRRGMVNVIETDKILNLFRGGLSYVEIGTAIGRAPQSVGNVIRDLGLARPRGGDGERKIKMSPAQRNEVMTLYERGYGSSTIAKMMGQCESRVYHELVRRGYLGAAG